MSRCALVIGAKEPVPGAVKTRLGRTLGHDRAAALYRAFLADLAARFRSSAGYDLLWAYAPAGADWCAVVGDGGAGAGAFPQVGPDWTERQRHIFRETAVRGYMHTVLIASDSPQLSRPTVAVAFAALSTHTAVLVPTYDGGYSLIGQRRGVDILADTPMSTGTVCTDLHANARRQGQAMSLLPPTWDVDEAADLAHLAAYLAGPHDAPATAAAFVALGLASDVASAQRVPLAQTGGMA